MSRDHTENMKKALAILQGQYETPKEAVGSDRGFKKGKGVRFDQETVGPSFARRRDRKGQHELQ
jgi:hypothetical protein